MITAYTRDGSDEFHRRLEAVLIRMSEDVERALGDNLVALVLGGGYGRGEGAVITTSGREMPYNDLDLTLVVKRKSIVPLDHLHAIGSTYAEELGIHVDFSRPLSLEDIRRWPRWLMWYDLLNGHVVLKGPEDLLSKNAPRSLREPLPPIEATRLLLNRGAGLLWALRVVRCVEEEPDTDFVRRNYYKCALALGDALLICHQRFTTAYLGRDDLLAGLQTAEQEVGGFFLLPLYREALRFKFRPDQVAPRDFKESDLSDLARLWGGVFLHVERIRAGCRWQTVDDYVRWRGIRERDQHTLPNIFRNVIRNLQMGRFTWKYPREALYRRLPVLLELAESKVRDWAAATSDFLRVWNRFN